MLNFRTAKSFSAESIKIIYGEQGINLRLFYVNPNKIKKISLDYKYLLKAFFKVIICQRISLLQ